ncbi:MAG: CBS domain-containing protein [Gammaproteobacteria bacterium]|nr:CBS domain-containing protein [Gammaproteobacteria bacterium]
MKTGELCIRDVVVVNGDTGIVEIAGLMREYHVGDVVVVKEKDGNRQPVGIVTDRDIVLEIVAREVPLGSCTAIDIMSGNLVTANENDDVWQVLEVMREKGIRRAPVVDNENILVGIISTDDIIDFLAEEMKQVVSVARYQPIREQQNRP